MSELDALRLDFALGGSVRTQTMAHAPKVWFRFSEATTSGTASARDSSGNGRHGTYNGPTRVDTRIAEGGYGRSFDGSNDRVYVPFHSSLHPTDKVSVEIWAYRSNWSSYAPSLGCMFGTLDDTLGKGYRFYFTSTPSLVFTVYANGAGRTVAFNTSSLAGGLHHFVGTFDGRFLKLYIDKVLKATTDLGGTFAIAYDLSNAIMVGADAGNTDTDTPELASYFSGEIFHAAMYNAALTEGHIQLMYEAGFWTDRTVDVWDDPGLTWIRGIGGTGPTDRIADIGEATGELFNSDQNSRGLEGLYSPGHPNQQLGFGRDTLARIVATFGGVEYPQFIGRIKHIDPEPGRNRTHRVPIVINDSISDLIDHVLRTVALQIGKTEGELLQTIIENIPPTVQPLALNFDASLDTSPYAFNNLEEETKAIQIAGDVVGSALGYLYVDPVGALRYENRQHRQISDSVGTFDNDMSEIHVATDLSEMYTRIRITVHPKRIDSAATTVLFSVPVASAAQPSTISIGAGETIEISGDYFNPTNVDQKIGGTAQAALVSGTDYIAKTNADGTGTDKSAAQVVTPSFYATSVTFNIRNTDPGAVFITTLQCKGKGLYDEAPVLVESRLAPELETQVLPKDIDLPYQSSPTFGKALADYLLAQYQPEDRRVQTVTFRGNDSDDFMLLALTLDVGDRITLTEAVTGLDMVDVFVNGLSITVSRGLLVDATLTVSPAIFANEFWQLEVTNHGELEQHTFLAAA